MANNINFIAIMNKEILLSAHNRKSRQVHEHFGRTLLNEERDVVSPRTKTVGTRTKEKKFKRGVWIQGMCFCPKTFRSGLRSLHKFASLDIIQQLVLVFIWKFFTCKYLLPM